MASTEATSKKSLGARLNSIGRVLWNSKKKQLVGRDGMEWAKIGLFYFVFYAALAGFFAIMLAIFMQIIDRKTPTYTTDSSVLANKGVNPGMGYRPQPTVDRNLIKYKINQTAGEDGWGLYHNTLHRFLQEYDGRNDSDVEYADCAQKKANGQACQFDVNSFAGAGTPCSESQYYMYPSGQPCVAVKVNNIFNWMPQAYSNSSLPDQIRQFWSEGEKDYIYVTCNGENAADVDNLHEIEYYSPLQNTHVGGIPFYYYPYRNQEGYKQPFVFVHFKNVTKQVLINVECRAWASNVDYDRFFMRGSVHIELMID